MQLLLNFAYEIICRNEGAIHLKSNLIAKATESIS